MEISLRALGALHRRRNVLGGLSGSQRRCSDLDAAYGVVEGGPQEPRRPRCRKGSQPLQRGFARVLPSSGFPGVFNAA
ncbi:hypothetical protein B0H12DRAFT_1091494 [Mycena haematopus]|nr:hypothetical protein B0H12DRAFT_1136721 [Mycena haematopus]KAJ7272655.1 hypothetical protein B0H12DRAFT_1091494 [Mycena haematopus]